MGPAGDHAHKMATGRGGCSFHTTTAKLDISGYFSVLESWSIALKAVQSKIFGNAHTKAVLRQLETNSNSCGATTSQLQKGYY